MNRILLCSSLRRLIVCCSLLGAAACAQAVTFNVTPTGTSNTYNGFITLQVNGLSTGETVVIRKYLDANANGIVEPSDYFVQQFQVQDGQGPTLIGGATNINIPYDHDGADGVITTTVPMATGIIQRFAAQYLYVLSSPSNHFAAITNTFAVSNPSAGQTVTGTVFNNSTPIPYAAVLIGTAANGDFNPTTGTVTDSNGVYSINVTPGTYMAVPLQNGEVGIPGGPFDIAPGATITNDLNLATANATISGQVVDSANASLPIPGLLISAEGNGFASSVTDPNGKFALGVTTGGQWKLSGDESSWDFLGYVRSNNNSKINVTGNISGLQLSYPKGDAMFYGRVVDGNNQPVTGVRLFGQNAGGSGPYQGDASTDVNGNYAMAVIDGNWDIEVDTGSLGPELAGYIFSQSPFGYSNGGGGTNLAPNSAVHQDFVALLATNTISGYLRDGNSNGIPNVQVFANATINGSTFSAQGTTDSSGFYSMNVGSATWNVYVNCCNGCDNGLPPSYQCPDAQTVTIANNNQTANFSSVTYTTFLSGRASDEFGAAISNIYVFAFPIGGGPGFGAMTDNGGMYSIGLVGGNYLVQLDTGASGGAPARGLLSPFIPLTISDNTSVSNFNLVARHTTGSIFASVTNGDNGQPVSGVYVSASATFNGTNYSTGVQMTTGGSTTMPVCDGSWDVSVDCSSLSTLNLQCVSNQTANVSGNSASVNFVVHGTATAPPPHLSVPFVYGPPGQFKFHLNGTPGQNYTIQYATALTNWATFLITNPSSSDVTISDFAATNKARAYRVIVGP